MITNDKRSLLEFIESMGGEVIIKPVDTSITCNPLRPTEHLFVMARTVSLEEARRYTEDQLKEVPVLVQQYIRKSREYRIIAFRDEAVFVRIDSQRHAASSVDWRRRQNDLSMFSVDEPDRGLQQRLASYLRQMGLQTGVFDFAIQSDDEAYFLECNPGGQWGWLDGVADGRISALAASSVLDFHLEQSERAACRPEPLRAT
jgi:glutathione synthase/RimK-type ligase-like ATP-grasp enzyme